MSNVIYIKRSFLGKPFSDCGYLELNYAIENYPAKSYVDLFNFMNGEPWGCIFIHDDLANDNDYIKKV